MNCEECRRRLLEADSHELRHDDTSELATHLRTCDGCRTHAALIVDDQERLRRAFDGIERRHAARARRRTPAYRVGSVLAAAAATAATVLLAWPQNGTTPPLEPQPEELFAALNPPRPLVETPPGVRAAVVQTDALTLVLLYEKEGR